MKFVVKLGGVALENPEVLQVCCKASFDLVSDGNQVAVVHGGGVQWTIKEGIPYSAPAMLARVKEIVAQAASADSHSVNCRDN